MSLDGAYDRENVFARMLRGELPCHSVYEDDRTLAFLDLYPQSRGHTLVIPKNEQARNLLELSDDGVGPLFLVARRVMKALVDEVEPDGVQLFQFNGGVGSQSVYHLHVHLVPRWPGQPLGMHAQDKGDSDELARLAAKLSTRLKSTS